MSKVQHPGGAIRALASLRKRPAARDRIAIAANATRILVIKPHDQLGDFVLTTPALRALRARYPRARLAVLTREFLAPLARRVKDIDDVWVLPRVSDLASIAHLASVTSSVMRFRPDVAFVMNSVSRSKSADGFAFWSGARLIVGRSRVFAGPISPDAPEDPGARALAAESTDPLYDVDVDVGLHSTAQAERLLDLVRWCAPTNERPLTHLELSENDRAAGRARIEEALRGLGDVDGPGRIVGLHPGAANELKCWPLESFVELGAELAGARDRLWLVVFDSPRERGRAAAVVAGLAARGVTAGLVPAGGIGEFAAACSALDLLACNDSGVMHIAAAVGIPTVSFHSLGDPREWAPRHDRSIAFYAPNGIAAIPLSAAIEGVRVSLALPSTS
ncbi:MAG TPA: glycosyltransferase family 9 protein [Candidatus Eisenbacteria bacterium]|nr:glycosyltransferase family 9 protein [Candidatus Eisenbacteria bacterium]